MNLLFQPLKRLRRLMKKANSALEKRAFKQARRQFLLDVIVPGDTQLWCLPEKRGLLTTLKLLLTKLKRYYYETKQNVTQEFKTFF